MQSAFPDFEVLASPKDMEQFHTGAILALKETRAAAFNRRGRCGGGFAG
jgi:hypothetical protein